MLITTKLKRKYAYVYFLTEEKTHKLKIDKNKLQRGAGIFGDNCYVTLNPNTLLCFPSVETGKDIDCLRMYWDELVDYGFEATY